MPCTRRPAPYRRSHHPHPGHASKRALPCESWLALLKFDVFGAVVGITVERLGLRRGRVLGLFAVVVEIVIDGRPEIRICVLRIPWLLLFVPRAFRDSLV